MVKFFDTLFYFAALCAALAIAIVVIDPQGTQAADRTLAAVFAVLTALLYGLRQLVRRKFSRFGLLTHKHRRPLSKKARQNAIQRWALLATTGGLSARMHAIGKQAPDAVVMLGVAEITRNWNAKAPSDDEIRSKLQLWDYADPYEKNRSIVRREHLRDVRDTTPFNTLRAAVDAIYAEQTRRDDAYQEWRDAVGDTCMDHLLGDGWIAFLQGLPGPDIHLWHAVATDHHEISDDRMAAAFWILDQDDCDRATASDFIRSYICFGLQSDLAHGDHHNVYRFAQIVSAYNAGRYTAHSITAGAFDATGFDDAQAARELDRIKGAYGPLDIPRPRGLIDETTVPTDDANRGYRSPYDFWDGEGLHLRYPGPDWREAG